MNNPGFNIAAVERETGLSKDVLRVWERRYGFPAPSRDDHGERIYPAEQVERLRLVKRLMDAGHRPGKLLATPTEELNALAPRRPMAPAVVSEPDAATELRELISLIKQHDGAGGRRCWPIPSTSHSTRQHLRACLYDTKTGLRGCNVPATTSTHYASAASSPSPSALRRAHHRQGIDEAVVGTAPAVG